MNVALSEVWEKGGEGGEALAQEVVRLCAQPPEFTFAYGDNLSIEQKIETIVRKIHHGDDVILTPNAKNRHKNLPS